MTDQSLISAVKSADVEAVQGVLQHYNAYNEDEQNIINTALSIAVMYEYAAIVSLLLKYGANIYHTDQYTANALITAARCHMPDIMALLLQSFHTPDELQQYYLNAALLEAAMHSKKEIVRLLLEYGADIDYITKDGETAFKVAARQPSQEVLEILLEKLALVEPNEQQQYYINEALLQAAIFGNRESALLLLQYGADVNYVDQKGDTALLIAAEYNDDIDIVQVLIENEANIHAIKHKSGRTALLIAAAVGAQEIVKCLLKQNANIFSTDYEGNNATSLALKYEHTDLAQYLHDYTIQALLNRLQLSTEKFKNPQEPPAFPYIPDIFLRITLENMISLLAFVTMHQHKPIFPNELVYDYILPSLLQMYREEKQNSITELPLASISEIPDIFTLDIGGDLHKVSEAVLKFLHPNHETKHISCEEALKQLALNLPSLFCTFPSNQKQALLISAESEEKGIKARK